MLRGETVDIVANAARQLTNELILTMALAGLDGLRDGCGGQEC
jgi:hypothetical protein